MVDAQTHLPAERIHAVIPPRKRTWWLIKQAKAVLKAQIDHARKCGALGIAAQHLSGPSRRVVNIAIIRRNIAARSASVHSKA